MKGIVFSELFHLMMLFCFILFVAILIYVSGIDLSDIVFVLSDVIKNILNALTHLL